MKSPRKDEPSANATGIHWPINPTEPGFYMTTKPVATRRFPISRPESARIRSAITPSVAAWDVLASVPTPPPTIP